MSVKIFSKEPIMWTHNFSVTISFAQNCDTESAFKPNRTQEDEIPNTPEDADGEDTEKSDKPTPVDKQETENQNTTEQLGGVVAFLEPGRGLLAYSKRLSTFCKPTNESKDGAKLLLEVPRNAECFPKKRPINHKLCFLDDPPYSTTVESYMPDYISDIGKFGSKDETTEFGGLHPCTCTCCAKSSIIVQEHTEKGFTKSCTCACCHTEDTNIVKEAMLHENVEAEDQAPEVPKTDLDEKEGNADPEMNLPAEENLVQGSPKSDTESQNVGTSTLEEHVKNASLRLCSCICCPKTKTHEEIKSPEKPAKGSPRSCACICCHTEIRLPEEKPDRINLKPCTCPCCHNGIKSTEEEGFPLKESVSKVSPRPCSCICCHPKNKSPERKASKQTQLRSCTCPCCPKKNKLTEQSPLKENVSKVSPRTCTCICCRTESTSSAVSSTFLKKLKSASKVVKEADLEHQLEKIASDGPKEYTFFRDSLPAWVIKYPIKT